MRTGWSLQLNFVGLAVCVLAAVVARADDAPVDFSRDVKPILSQNCFACHGPDEASREAGLRLDRADSALAVLDSGATAIVPGQPEASELIARITADDPSLRMPPASTGHVLTDAQIARLRQWIASGGTYDDHWSFRPVGNPQPPPVKNEAWVRHPIDRFVLARLEREGLAPSPEADRTTLLRRLSLDLLGLPPQPAEVAEFLQDASPDAYERLVDRLLASPPFGERWGRHWLDLAHYADSEGYLGDTLRPYAWLYRDWVINAINRDLPFDQFTVEQLAGDLLPEATLEQRIATGFLRNTLRNTEAGVDLEEYRLKEIVDRVSTIGIGWLGLSVGCAECHSHKYDPISHREFYELFAFFNNADDVDIPAPRPGEVEQYEAQLAAWNERHAELSGAVVLQLAARQEAAPGLDRQTLLAALATEAKKRTTEQKKIVELFKNDSDAALQRLCDNFETHAIKKPQPPATNAMTLAPRKTARESYVHLRGDYRSRGDDVTPGTPAVLPPLQVRSDEADRLDLARWLVDADHPLTARVTVNRFWRHLFGRGLVASVDNFGSGGEPPSHAELLDWLARHWVAEGWSVKSLVRGIVTSSTYRQASHGRDDLAQRDPLNVLLARQARLRLEAEVVRDVTLSASGLIERKIGGPGIRPPQPAYVASISRNVEWNVTPGADQYRRGLYILFRRATPYPMLLLFDAPDSTVACAQRERSNSPLQALTLLNDPVFFECAQALGGELSAASRGTREERLAEIFLRCLGRDPRPAEKERLDRLYEEHYDRLSTDLNAVRAILEREDDARTPNKAAQVQSSEGAAANNSDLEQAAWILTARVLLNLDEFITRE
jgi:mono/diheme cytochrome c family protein